MSQCSTHHDPAHGSSRTTTHLDGADRASGSGRPVVLPSRPDSLLPVRRPPPSASFDVFAQLEGRRVMRRSVGRDVYRGQDHEADVAYLQLLPNEWARIPLGFRVDLPPGVEAQLRTRPETMAKRALVVLSPEPVPADAGDELDGEWTVMVRNGGSLTVSIDDGDPIATLVFARVVPGE